MLSLRFGTSILFVALLMACSPDEAVLPILTDKAFFRAAKDCSAVEPMFTFQIEGKLPRIGFTVQSSEETSGKTAQCLADALAGYRFAAMEIKIARPA